jgi:hypothetical protein
MAKVNGSRITAIKGHFQHAAVITQDNLADLIDAIAEAAEAHQHTASGGDGSGSGDAGPVVNLQHGATAQKPVDPEVGDVYLETDTAKLFACFSAGSWTEIVSDVGLPGVGAGDNVCVSSDEEKETANPEWVKAKEIRIYRPGTYRIQLDLAAYGEALTAYGRVYRNGSPVGTERSTSESSWTTFSEDIEGWGQGDLIQLWYRQAGGTGSEAARVRNFRVCYDQGPLDGSVTLS